ncbi:D-isomer specific 2-hydroxyacid dehydrogenase [Xylariales sp. AK1849]|nr:D-isomer specific 2-hydroxyacid dehydrogenase [Xylariales sp. AK1849]
MSAEVSVLSKDILLIIFMSPPRQDWISRVQDKYPGIQIRWVNLLNDDRSFKEQELIGEEVWQGVTIVCPFLMPPPSKFLSSVRFVQLPSAGIDRWTGHPVYEDKSVMFCTTNGAHAPQIGEWVIGSWLSHQHHFVRYVEQMKTGYWEPMTASTVQDSTSARMGILGYGAIGRQCARVANAMGMEVYAYTRSERLTAEKRKDDSYCVPGTGDPDGIVPAKWFHGSTKEDINNFLGQDLDLLVVSLPLTKETRGIISHEQFEILSRKKTFVANIARGGHINQEALIEALESQKIRGAALDVTDPEPLPKDHPLWKSPNLLITPHVSWQTGSMLNRILDIFEVNLEKLNAGERPINVVNRDLHY